MSKKWNALFSRTGSEITEISKKLGRWPDRIITNKQDLSNVSKELLKNNTIYHLSKKPTEKEYLEVLEAGALITLNGFLRVVPPSICARYEIYNGHPGLIQDRFFPELKGKDPQKRAWENKHQIVGCVIHKVIPAVDEGEILSYKATTNNFNSEEQLMQGLHDISVNLWVQFLQEKLK